MMVSLNPENIAESSEQVAQMSFDALAPLDHPVEESSKPAVSEPISPPDHPIRKPVTRPAAPAGISGRHQDVRLYMAVLLKTFAEETDAGLIREAPYIVRLSKRQLYEPDITFIASANLERVQDMYVDGAADLIVEIVSEESTAVDRGDKFVAYEAAGVREYWLIDPLRELADLYHLGADGRYDVFRPDTGGRLHSRVLKNFILDTSTLWRRVLPTTLETVEMVQAMVKG